MKDIKLTTFLSQMNPHFVFNTLNAIQYFITSNEKISALNYLSTFSKLFRYHLQNAEKEKINLPEEIEMLHLYLKLQKLRYGNRFDYKLDLLNKKKEAVIPTSILPTLIENIVEYSIYKDEKDCFIAVLFEVHKKTVKIKVTFTYAGNASAQRNYSPDYRNKILDWQAHIEKLNQLNHYNIQKEIIMNTDPDGHFKGGSVALILPNLM